MHLPLLFRSPWRPRLNCVRLDLEVNSVGVQIFKGNIGYRCCIIYSELVFRAENGLGPGTAEAYLGKNYVHVLTGAAINLFVVTLNLEQPYASVEAFWVLSLGLVHLFFQPIALNQSSFRNILSKTELDIMFGGSDIFFTKLADWNMACCYRFPPVIDCLETFHSSTAILSSDESAFLKF